MEQEGAALMSRRIVTYDEEDAYTSWRRFYPSLRRAGVVKAIKRVTHRRERREAKAEIRDAFSERSQDLAAELKTKALRNLGRDDA